MTYLSILEISQLLLLHPFNGPFSGTSWVIWQQKGKPFWILPEREMMRWQWYQLDHMQVICTLRQTDDHATTPFFTGRMPFLPPTSSIKALKVQS